MNVREQFIEVMDFNKQVSPPKWEFGYWGQTMDNWYESGLPKKEYPVFPSRISTPASHYFTPAWQSVKTGKLPKNGVVMAGGLYWPAQGWPVDNDVRNYLNMDKSQVVVNVNLVFHPMFDTEIYEDERYFDYVDLDGVKRRFIKEDETFPSALEFPIIDRQSWEKLKDERLNFNDIKDRFPANWDQLVKIYKSRDFPLALGGYPQGFFGILATLMGYEKLFVNYFDDPGFIHDIVKTFTDLWIAIYSEVFQHVKVDHVHIWEDISYGRGSMVSPEHIKEFMIPYYKKFTDFLRSEGVDIILVDTDGDCMDIIPLLMEGGINGMYPFEWHCGMDIVKVRKDFPDLKMLGGIPKSEICQGRKRIDEILEPVKEVLKTGGYIPFGDHFIPPEVDWENFKYYRTKLNDIIDSVSTY
jgi:uroporphyrinogen decarboxylase